MGLSFYKVMILFTIIFVSSVALKSIILSSEVFCWRLRSHQQLNRLLGFFNLSMLYISPMMVLSYFISRFKSHSAPSNTKPLNARGRVGLKSGNEIALLYCYCLFLYLFLFDILSNLKIKTLIFDRLCKKCNAWNFYFYYLLNSN